MYLFIEKEGKVVGVLEKSNFLSAIYLDGKCKLRGQYSNETWDIPMTADDFAKLVRQFKLATF